MATILFFVMLWLVLWALKAITRPRKRREYTSQENSDQSNMAALLALQQQREIIENTIAELTGWLDVSETAAETLRIRSAIAAQYGKLATVEKNIKKLTG